MSLDTLKLTAGFILFGLSVLVLVSARWHRRPFDPILRLAITGIAGGTVVGMLSMALGGAAIIWVVSNGDLSSKWLLYMYAGWAIWLVGIVGFTVAGAGVVLWIGSDAHWIWRERRRVLPFIKWRGAARWKFGPS